MTFTTEITGRTMTADGVGVALRRTSIVEYAPKVRAQVQGDEVLIELGHLDQEHWPPSERQSLLISPDQAEHLAAVLKLAAGVARTASKPNG